MGLPSAYSLNNVYRPHDVGFAGQWSDVSPHSFLNSHPLALFFLSTLPSCVYTELYRHITNKVSRSAPIGMNITRGRAEGDANAAAPI